MAEIIDPAERGDTMQLPGEPQKLARRFGMAVESDRLRIRDLVRRLFGHVVHNPGGMHMNTPTDAKAPPRGLRSQNPCRTTENKGHSSERFASAGVVRRLGCTLACWRALQRTE